MRVAAGFTLLELMVALTLFGLIGVACNAILYSVTHAGAAEQKKLERLADLERAVTIIEEDVSQRDPATFVVGGAHAVEFCRIGWRNVLQPRSHDRECIAYDTVKEVLFRSHRPYGDGGAWSIQTLITGVSNLSVTTPAPALVEWRMIIAGLGPVRRVFSVPEP